MAGSGDLCWCLKRLGESQDRLLLPEGEEVTVGRGIGVTYQLVSKECPLMISRTHCIFRQNAAGQWTVTDNNIQWSCEIRGLKEELRIAIKILRLINCVLSLEYLPVDLYMLVGLHYPQSLNGAWLNKEKMEPQKTYILTKGSCVQLGVPPPNMDMAEFEYQLVQENLEQIKTFLIRPLPGKSKPPRTKRKLNCDDSEASGTEGTSNMAKAKVQRSLRDGDEVAKSYKTELSKQPTVKVLVEEPGLEGSVEEATATQPQCPITLQLSILRQSIAEVRSLNLQLHEIKDAMGDKLKSGPKGSKCLQELNSHFSELIVKREDVLQSVCDLKRLLKDEEQKKKDESLLTEDKGLKEQLAQTFQEYSLLMDEMFQARNKELQETQKVEAQKQEVFNHMNDVLDNELQCIICSEHFIEAVTLNCAHSFCSYCIQSWRKRKDECPICRQEIKSQTRSLVLDNCIDRMVDKLSPDMKDRRMALILERKDLAQEVIPILTDTDSSSLPSDTSLLSSSGDSDELGSGTELDEISYSEDQLDMDSEDGYDDDDYNFFFFM